MSHGCGGYGLLGPVSHGVGMTATDVAAQAGSSGSTYYGDPTGRQQSNGGMASQVSDWWGNATTPTKALVIGAGLLAAYGIYSYAKQ